MPARLHIDFVSDVACPWCAIGLASLEQALLRTRDIATAVIHFHPFELNPDMRAGGENVDAFLGARYGANREQLSTMRETLRRRSAAVGFEFNQHGDSRMYNTFDAHRLLHLVKEAPAMQRALKHALFKANFTDNADVSSHAVLTDAAAAAGLDPAAARDLLASDLLTQEVRDAQRQWLARGISAVPAMVIHDKWLISGGQPAEEIEKALRTIAAKSGGHIIP